MSCPVIVYLSHAKKLLASYPKLDGQDIGNFMFSEFENCSNNGVGGGYQRGGVDKKTLIKGILYAALALLGANAAMSATSLNTIGPGIQMMFAGECSKLGNLTWSVFGLENPVCAVYNRLLATIGKALLADPDAITRIIGGITASGGALYGIDALVDRIAQHILDTLNGKIATMKGPNRRSNDNGSDPSGPGQTAGGRRKSRTRHHKKAKHTRKH